MQIANTITYCYFLTTKATPIAVNTIPIAPASVNDSPNSVHAISAVTGGVRYIKLDTCVAAFFRISAYSKNMAPIDKAKTDQHSAPINCGVHMT